MCSSSAAGSGSVSHSPFGPAHHSSRYNLPQAAIDPDTSKHWLLRISPVVWAHRGPLVAGLVSAFVALVLQIAIPRVTMQAIDQALIAGKASLAFFVWLLLALAAGRAVAVLLFRSLLFRVAYKIEFDLRALFFEHVCWMSLPFFDRVQSGQLISRANSDIRGLQMFLVFAPFVLVTTTNFFVAFAIMLSIHVSLAVVSFAPLPLVYLTALRMRQVAFPTSWIVQDRVATVATIVEENVTGVHVVKSFAAEPHQISLLARAANRLRWACLRMNGIRAVYAPVMENLPRVGTALVLLYGGLLTMQGETTVGALVAFSAYVLILQTPFRLLGMMMMMSQRSAASAHRIFDILDAQPEIVDRAEARDLVRPKGEVAFEDVTFSYDGERDVLHQLSFRLAPGECVALVGRTGSGKTSLVKLLTRFYEAQKGQVKIDGHDVRDLRMASLREHVGLVEAEPILFSTSVKENVAYGKPQASMEEIVAAAKAAGAHDFIHDLPQGYDTQVGERGYSLSGGERQRVAIARTLLRDARVLILDDATSAVDVHMEQQIHQALRAITQNRTTLIIAHRLSTIGLADRVLFLEDGRIVAQGTHAELLQTEPRYAEVLARAEEEEADMRAAAKTTTVPPSPLDTAAELAPLEDAFDFEGFTR